ncbi:unnamed protein product [Orchesella dallaii]|uniref:Chitin-binding type-2 domain-containing protein n=1 Tax=Orchesella dallaii TaxID=48710 RepID=A0ABP1R0E0_9HEXA
MHGYKAILIISAVVLSTSLVADSFSLSSLFKAQDDVNPCPGNFTGMVPNPDDCQSFYICDNGIPGLIPCPSELCFHPSGGCDYCANVPGCEDSGSPATTGRPTTPSEAPTTPSEAPTTPSEAPTTPSEAPTTPSEAPTTPSEAPTTPSEAPTTPSEAPTTPSEAPTTTSSQPPPTSSEPTTEATTTTTESTTTNIITEAPTTTPEVTTTTPTTTTTQRTTTSSGGDLPCPNDPYIYMPYPGDCNKFYYCQDGVNSGTYNCGAGLWFNFSIQACIVPWGPSCN